MLLRGKSTTFFLIMQTLARLIGKIIDFFYEKVIFFIPSAEKILSRQFFRYGACGGSNMVFDWILYFLFYHFLYYYFGSEVFFPHISELLNFSLVISPHILAFGITFPITLLTGFWLNKYVTFTQSSLAGSRQLMRYIEIVLLNLLVNYVGLKFFVEYCHFYPTPSKMLVTLITVAISYLGQKYYSFRK